MASQRIESKKIDRLVSSIDKYLQDERVRRVLWRGRLGPAFWTTASVISLVVNIILLAFLIALARELFTLQSMVSDRLVGGLYENFVKMDQAHIQTTILVSDTIQVKDTLPVVFDLPLKKGTRVTITQDTPVGDTTIYLNGAAVPLDLVLPKGTELNIQLDLSVPVSQTIPVELDVPVRLNVPVDIPLDQTQLHDAFLGLRTVIEPYHLSLSKLPDTVEEAPFCGPGLGWLCRLFFNE
jgi:hypothetical protein